MFVKSHLNPFYFLPSRCKLQTFSEAFFIAFILLTFANQAFYCDSKITFIRQIQRSSKSREDLLIIHIQICVDDNFYLMDLTIHTFGDFRRFILHPFYCDFLAQFSLSPFGESFKNPLCAPHVLKLVVNLSFSWDLHYKE